MSAMKNQGAAGLDAMREQAAVFWQARDARERRVLVLGAVSVVLALVYVLLLDPALRGRAVLQKSLPVLRAQAAQMQSLEAQLSGLKRATLPPAVMPTKDALSASLAKRSLKPQTLLLSGETVRLELTDVSYAALIAWLDEMHNGPRLSLVSLSFEVLATTDRVNARLSLRLANDAERAR